MRLVIHVALMVVLACSAAGCFVARSGERDGRVEVPPLPGSVWAVGPAEYAAAGGTGDAEALAADEVDLATLHAQTLEAFGDDGWQHRDDEMRRRRLVYSGLAAGGLLRVVDDQSLGRQIVADVLGLGWVDDVVTGFKPNATFLSEQELARQRQRQRIEAQVKAEEAAAHASRVSAAAPGAGDEAPGGENDEQADDERAGGRGEDRDNDSHDESHDESEVASGSGGEGDSPKVDLFLNAGVDVGVPLEVSPDSKGVMVHLPALMGTKYERRAVERLRELGWTVLHVRGPTGVRPPPADDMARYEADTRRSTRMWLRFDEMDDKTPLASNSVQWDPNSGDVDIRPGGDEYEQIAQAVYSEIPMPPTGLEAQPGESPVAVAQRIAAAADRGFAETALAADAALTALLELHPHLQGRPVVVIGFSAGAIPAPAVAVRLGDRADAVVLIGGGADGLTVSQTSSVTHGGVRLAPPDGPEPSREFVEAVREAYRELSQLDPYNAAPRLGDVPVLQVMARGDLMVPTEHQWTLWERLGRPDRLTWHGPLGHKGLFYFLSGQMGRIDRWVMREIARERNDIPKGMNTE